MRRSGKNDALKLGSCLTDIVKCENITVVKVLELTETKVGKTLLFWAIQKNVTKYILDEKRFLETETALHMAAGNDRVEAIRILLDKGIDRTGEDICGNTAKGTAMVNSADDALAYFLGKGIE
ncbi:Uu.00g049430.m01.CDS01 [Anthostomella pinea]|uniref:Uu.00g049430.m01.CDS01 n=1 Tax=Anthostomella pinea TaxID=933095 RepID=A0AAI8VCW4_9PEZI|nr:Uu.00g049430.m01.CDS01 [Anthostomella pinea]